MDALVSLVLFTGLIFVLMRLAARHHASRDAHITSRHEVEPVTPFVPLPEAVDPVCGMRVAANEGFLVAHQGVEYRFCSLACVEAFESTAAMQGRHAA